MIRDEVGKLFKDYPTILDTAQKLKDAGYRIFLLRRRDGRIFR